MTGNVGIGKKYPSIGVCGIDCCLCPMCHIREGDGCPGCTAPTASGRSGRWCAMARCAVRERCHETCADCVAYPCERLNSIDEDDSFVTHRKALENLQTIRTLGIDSLLRQQEQRLVILRQMLAGFDDGRSKSHYCLACALLPIENLTSVMAVAGELKGDGESMDERKKRAQMLRQRLNDEAERTGMVLRLRHSRRQGT